MPCSSTERGHRPIVPLIPDRYPKPLIFDVAVSAAVDSSQLGLAGTAAGDNAELLYPVPVPTRNGPGAQGRQAVLTAPMPPGYQLRVMDP